VGEPSGPGVLFLHWFDEAPNANRSQYLEEAEILAAAGVASVLPQLGFPWKAAPTDAESDIARIEGEVEFLRGAWSRLCDVDGVDADRIAVVGHDFGAMYGTLLLSELGPRCAALVAATARWADWFVRFWPITTDRYDYMRQLDRLDPITAIAQPGCPLLFQFGLKDFYIAVMTARELFDAAPELKTYRSYEAGHAMDLDEIRSDRLAFVAEHLAIDL
jgi:pimeloyl-ACP methyl ester carboxylesterase